MARTPVALLRESLEISWAQHSEEIVALPTFLDFTDPNPIVIQPNEPASLQNVHHISLGGAPVQNFQSILENFMFDPSMDILSLSELLNRMRIPSIPTQCNGVIYSGFPPRRVSSIKDCVVVLLPLLSTSCEQWNSSH